VRYGKGSWGKIRKSAFEMVASGILAMLLFLRVENHYPDWSWGEKVEKVRCQIENGWHLALVGLKDTLRNSGRGLGRI
jgi:hypothetical protein